MERNNEAIRQSMQWLLRLHQTEVIECVEDRDGNILITLVSTQEGTECHLFIVGIQRA